MHPRRPGASGGDHELVSQGGPAIVEVQLTIPTALPSRANQDLDPSGVCIDFLFRIRRQLPVDEIGDEHLRWTPAFDTLPAVAAHTGSFATD